MKVSGPCARHPSEDARAPNPAWPQKHRERQGQHLADAGRALARGALCDGKGELFAEVLRPGRDGQPADVVTGIPAGLQEGAIGGLSGRADLVRAAPFPQKA
jgi:hypothetical protein